MKKRPTIYQTAGRQGEEYGQTMRSFETVQSFKYQTFPVNIINDTEKEVNARILHGIDN